MATLVREEDIIISVDPGYDATKVCINGILFKIPNNVIDITGNEGSFLTLGEERTVDYISSKYLNGKNYLVGSLARKSMKEKEAREKMSSKKDAMDSYERFETTDFEVNLMSVIGVALIEYAKSAADKEISIARDTRTGVFTIPELIERRILLGITLPNDALETAWPNIKKFLAQKHCYCIETADGCWDLAFNIEPGHVMSASQVICALYGTAADDEGMIYSNNNVLSKLPAVVIDGGYKTVGIFMLTQAHKAAEAESNTEYAMGNIHKEVSRILKEKYNRDNIEPYQIPAILEEDDGVVVYKKGGVTEKVQIKDIIMQEEQKLCEKLIEYVNEKFEDLLDVKQLIVTGGTGAAYYTHIDAYIKNNRQHLKDSTILTNYEFLGKKIEPVYAITIGMYKMLKNQSNKAKKIVKAKK